MDKLSRCPSSFSYHSSLWLSISVLSLFDSLGEGHKIFLSVSHPDKFIYFNEVMMVQVVLVYTAAGYMIQSWAPLSSYSPKHVARWFGCSKSPLGVNESLAIKLSRKLYCLTVGTELSKDKSRALRQLIVVKHIYVSSTFGFRNKVCCDYTFSRKESLVLRLGYL